MHYLKQFKKHIAENDYSAVAVLWEEYCESDQVDADELLRILEAIQSSPAIAKPFGKHVENGIKLWEMIDKDQTAHAVIKLIFDLQTTNSSALLQFITDYLNERYPQSVTDIQKLRLVGLRDSDTFQGALSAFELLEHMKKGNFAFHTGGWGVGEIMDVSFLREQLSLEFDYVGGRKDLSFKNAFKTLIPLPPEHFLARRFGNPDEFESFAKKHPLDALRLFLRDLGPKTAQDIKDAFCDLVIPQDQWQKWWQAARAKAKKDTTILVPEDLRGEFALASGEESHEDRLHIALENQQKPQLIIQFIYNFLRDFPASLKNENFRNTLRQKITDIIATSELTDAEALQFHFFLEDLASAQDHKGAEELIKNLASIEEVVHQIDIIAFKKRTLQQIKQSRTDWKEIFLSLIFTTEQNVLKDFIIRELMDSGEQNKVKDSLEHLLQHPAQSPQSVLWYFKKIIRKEHLPFADDHGKCRLLEALLIALGHLDQDMSNNRDQVKRIHTFLSSGRFSIVRKIFAQAPIETTQEFLLLASKCLSFTEHEIKIFHSLAEVVHPSLKKIRKFEDEKEEDVIWATEAGLSKVKHRIEQIGTVEMIENAKEIEVAREHGDLRENAEYKAAQERRARLQNELKSLSSQLKKSRILTPNDIQEGIAGVGTTITFENTDSDKKIFTILGPWEADTEKNILSFKSKLAQEIDGKKVGDTVTIQSVEYRIVSVQSVFEESNQ